MGRLESAQTDLDKAIQMNPSLEWAVVRHLMIGLMMQRLDSELGWLDSVIRANPNESLYYFARSQLRQIRGEPKNAREDLEQACHLAECRYKDVPTDSINTLIVLYLLALARSDKARTVLSRHARTGFPPGVVLGSIDWLDQVGTVLPDLQPLQTLRNWLTSDPMKV